MTTSPDAARPTPFTFERPEVVRARTVQILGRTDILGGAVHVVHEGGETNLHAHPHFDAFWFVLSGRARFHTVDDEVVGELGTHQGLVVPRGFPYWYESCGDEVLEILQVVAADDPTKMLERIDLGPRDGGRGPNGGSGAGAGHP